MSEQINHCPIHATLNGTASVRLQVPEDTNPLFDPLHSGDVTGMDLVLLESADLSALQSRLDAAERERDQLRQQLAERDAVLRDIRRYGAMGLEHSLNAQIDALLSSAEPVKCRNCDGHGVIGWTTGQTAESFDQGEALCPECDGTGEPAKGGDGEVKDHE